MNTSQTTGLCEPIGSDKVSLGTLGYIRALNRQRQYDVIIKEFKHSGISQADLAKRLGKAPEIVCRLLARPTNWEADTYSDLLFCISGGVAKYEVDYPFQKKRVQPAFDFPYKQMPISNEKERGPVGIEAKALPAGAKNGTNWRG
jgi:hypothetical protein